MGSMFTLLRNPNWENWNLAMAWVHKRARGVLPLPGKVQSSMLYSLGKDGGSMLYSLVVHRGE